MECVGCYGEAQAKPSFVNFVEFSSNTTACLGKVLIKVNSQDEPLYVMFYVASMDKFVEHVILGHH